MIPRQHARPVVIDGQEHAVRVRVWPANQKNRRGRLRGQQVAQLAALGIDRAHARQAPTGIPGSGQSLPPLIPAVSPGSPAPAPQAGGFVRATRRGAVAVHCARPVEMDYHVESICESCTFFVTTIESRPTLELQRDDAAAKGQVAHEQIFDGLVSRLDGEAS
ncbi:hypothetical protein [Streptomyces sp. NPDC001205]